MSVGISLGNKKLVFQQSWCWLRYLNTHVISWWLTKRRFLHITNSSRGGAEPQLPQNQSHIIIWCGQSAAHQMVYVVCVLCSVDSLLGVMTDCCSANMSFSFSSSTGSLDSAATCRTTKITTFSTFCS